MACETRKACIHRRLFFKSDDHILLMPWCALLSSVDSKVFISAALCDKCEKYEEDTWKSLGYWM